MRNHPVNATDSSPDKRRKTILVIDDEPDILTFISTVLADAGYEIVSAGDGEEALEKLQAITPDLITLDITMPNRTGVRLYRDLRESERWKEIPVVIITGISADFRRFISTRRQVPPPEGFVPKPIDVELLLNEVSRLTPG